MHTICLGVENMMAGIEVCPKPPKVDNEDINHREAYKSIKKLAIQKFRMTQSKIKQHGIWRKNKKLRSLLSVSLIATSIVVGYLWISSSYQDVQNKPENVPEDAVRVGGEDGGCYICIRSEFADTSNFAIYNDFSGELWSEGFFVCEKPEFESVKSFDWHDLLIGYDGDKIIMRDPRKQQQYIIWKKL